MFTHIPLCIRRSDRSDAESMFYTESKERVCPADTKSFQGRAPKSSVIMFTSTMLYFLCYCATIKSIHNMFSFESLLLGTKFNTTITLFVTVGLWEEDVHWKKERKKKIGVPSTSISYHIKRITPEVTKNHNQEWDSNPREHCPLDPASNALTTRPSWRVPLPEMNTRRYMYAYSATLHLTKRALRSTNERRLPRKATVSKKQKM